MWDRPALMNAVANTLFAIAALLALAARCHPGGAPAGVFRCAR